MKKKISIFILALFCASAIMAQAEEQKAQLFMVEEIPVFPSKVNDVETHIKMIQKMADQYQFPFPIHVYSTADLNYHYVIPIKDFADIDTLYQARMEWIQRMGDENVQSLVKSGLGTYKNLKWFIIRHRPDLSYASDKPRFKPEKANYLYMPFCYVEPGKEGEFENICKEWVALDKSVGRADSYELYAGDIGTEMSVYFWVARAKSEADFHSQQEIYGQKIGEKGGELWNRTMALCRRFEVKTGWFRPDLSYTPKGK